MVVFVFYSDILIGFLVTELLFMFNPLERIYQINLKYYIYKSEILARGGGQDHRPVVPAISERGKSLAPYVNTNSW
jgi:hypothetical protein